ncbi:MAG TPA: sensor histidine kinase [Terriglobales bacterium]
MRLIPKPKDPKHFDDPGPAPYIWLVFLAFFYFQPILDPKATAKEWVVTIAATLVFLVLYFGLFWCKRPWSYLIIGAMVAMGLALGDSNQGASIFIIYASMFLGWTFNNARRSLLAVGALVALLGADAFFFHAPLAFWGTAMIVSVGVGLSNTFFAERNRALAKLRLAQDEIEHLAKVAERERIARDLHDVLGHTLSLIIVKSTLAGKLLDPTATQAALDPQRARNEVADIEKVSREAMAEIRSTLRGYNTYKLSEEFQRAKATLNSAGVAVESQTADVNLSPAQESVVALILREAVTNVVRHAQARHCRLLLGTNDGNCVLEIQDDGHALFPDGVQVEGNGLRGMRERVEALGGSINRQSSSGTLLHFEFPISANGNGVS